MKQGAEAFKPTHPGDEPKIESAVVHRFPMTYEAYKNLLDGTLNQEDYEVVKNTVGDNKWSHYADFMAKTAGIEFLPKETIAFYNALCDKRPGLAKERPELGDRELLAEAFRMAGDKDSLDKFLDIKNYPDILKQKP